MLFTGQGPEDPFSYVYREQYRPGGRSGLSARAYAARGDDYCLFLRLNISISVPWSLVLLFWPLR
jgi:hypothetical protein